MEPTGPRKGATRARVERRLDAMRASVVAMATVVVAASAADARSRAKIQEAIWRVHRVLSMNRVPRDELHLIQDIFDQPPSKFGGLFGKTATLSHPDKIKTTETTEGGTVEMTVYENGEVYLKGLRLDDVEAEVSLQRHWKDKDKIQIFRRYLPNGPRTVGESSTDAVPKLHSDETLDLLGGSLEAFRGEETDRKTHRKSSSNKPFNRSEKGPDTEPSGGRWIGEAIASYEPQHRLLGPNRGLLQLIVEVHNSKTLTSEQKKRYRSMVFAVDRGKQVKHNGWMGPSSKDSFKIVLLRGSDRDRVVMLIERDGKLSHYDLDELTLAEPV